MELSALLAICLLVLFFGEHLAAEAAEAAGSEVDDDLCRTVAKSNGTVNLEIATNCLVHYAAKMVRNIPECKYEIVNIYCRKSPLKSQFVVQFQAWAVLRVRLLRKLAEPETLDLADARRLLNEAFNLIHYHETTQVDLCAGNEQCENCVRHNLDCTFTKFPNTTCTSEGFFRVVGHTPKKIETDCQRIYLE